MNELIHTKSKKKKIINKKGERKDQRNVKQPKVTVSNDVTSARIATSLTLKTCRYPSDLLLSAAGHPPNLSKRNASMTLVVSKIGLEAIATVIVPGLSQRTPPLASFFPFHSSRSTLTHLSSPLANLHAFIFRRKSSFHLWENSAK